MAVINVPVNLDSNLPITYFVLVSKNKVINITNHLKL